MAGFCTVDHVIPYIPGLKKGGSSDVTEGAIQKLIDNQYARIMRVANRKQYDLPDPNSFDTPTTNMEMVLHLLNIEIVVAEVIRRRSGNVEPQYLRMAGFQKKVADNNFLDFENGKLFLAFESVLPVDPLADATDAAEYGSGFPLTPTTTPSTDDVQLWCDIESAYIQAIAAYLGYLTTPYDDLSDIQKNTYRSFVAEKVGSHYIRSRALQFPVLNTQAFNVLSNAEKIRAELRNKEYDDTLGVFN